jgi:uncharacterized protein YecT (DUF1311 family)
LFDRLCGYGTSRHWIVIELILRQELDVTTCLDTFVLPDGEKILTKFRNIWIIALSGACAFTASGLAYAETSYATFMPEQSQLSTVLSETYRRCDQTSGTNTFRKQECASEEITRLERRINESYRARLLQLTGSDARAYRGQQQIWQRTRDRACLAKVDAARNAPTLGFDAQRFDESQFVNQLTQCRLEEFQRRAVWFNSPT